jgi:hypothetical protein
MEFYQQEDRRVDLATARDLQRLGHLWIPVPRPTPLAASIRAALLNALAFTDGDQKAAGACLGLSPRVMCYQMQTYDIPTARGPWRSRVRLSPRRKFSLVVVA